MAAKKKAEEDEGGEFADFMADISHEIAQRVESLDAAPRVESEPKKATPAEPKKPTPVSADAGVILNWENVVDRMIEDMR
jgi:hypothetical protein